MGRDPPAMEQDDALDLRDDFLHVMGDQDQGRPVARDSADAFHEIVARHQIQAGRGLVEDQRAGRRHESACEHYAARLAAGHLIQAARGQVADAHHGERFRRPFAHRTGHDAIPKDAVGHEEA